MTLALVLAFWLTFLGLLAIAADARCRTHKCWHRVHVKRQHHWIRNHYWQWRWHHVSPSLKARLAHLRWCESTNNYRAVNGPYTGAYQYHPSTWARAGGSGSAMYAPAREQDVRTAWFWPSHMGEWECKA